MTTHPWTRHEPGRTPGSAVPLRLEVEHLARGGRCLVTVHGDLDVGSVSALRRCLRDLVVDGHVHLVVDLGSVGFLDSSGLGALVGARRTARTLQGSLVLVGRQERFVRLMRMTGLTQVFSRYDTVDDALATR